jgi:hypothetical protein
VFKGGEYMTALELLKEELKSAREVFAGTVGDVTSDMLHQDPGGKALPLGATYAHVVLSEDMERENRSRQTNATLGCKL